MSAIDEIVTELSGDGTPFRAVAGAASLASIEDSVLAKPAAFVLCVEEASGENTRINGNVLQRCEADISIVIVLDNLGDVAMGDAAADIETYKDYVRGRILGFVPTTTDEPMTHVSGQLLKARHSTVWFEDKFALATYLEQS